MTREEGPPRDLGLAAFLGCSTVMALAEPCIRFGVSWYLLKATGSVALFASLFGLSLLADSLSRPVLAPLSDHFDRLKVFRLCTVLAVSLSLALAAAVAWLPFQPWLLGGLLVSLGLVAGLREPTASALLADLARPEQLAQAQAFQTSANAIITFLGPALGGTLVALLDPAAALAGAVALEATGLVGLALMRRARGPAAQDGAAASWSAYRADWRRRIVAGLLCLWRTRVERNVILAAMLINTSVVCFVTVCIPVWVSRELQGTAGLMALLEGSFGGGMLFGSALLLGWLNRGIGRQRATAAGLGLAAAAFVLLGTATSPPLLMVLTGCVAAGMCVASINTGTVRALATPTHYRSRMAGATSFVLSLLLPAAIPLAGQLLQAWPTQQVLWLCAGLFTLGAGLLVANATSRALLRSPEGELVGRYATLYPAAFPEPQPPRG